MAKTPVGKRIRALKVHQWLGLWDNVEFDAKHHRRKPQPFFYLFSMSAAELKTLCGISRRDAKGVRPRAVDLGIQRQHDPDRSDEIKRFVEYGYPWSTLSESKRASDEFDDLRKPGWLPTAVVINILADGQVRDGIKIKETDVVKVEDSDSGAEIELPYAKWSKDWRSDVPPFEVIDGQHRLWAFDASSGEATFEVPVVAFHNLDISWQAYLFWTINIKPKRINQSLAFDLYPLLRAEDWLERAEEHIVYRDTRSQELTEALWSYPKSPWFDKINMLGERLNRWVTQAAWIRSLNASFIRAWSARGGGGLFGTRIGPKGEAEVLPWHRAQQAAFLIYCWQQLQEHVAQSKDDWAKALRTPNQPSLPLQPTPSFDQAFYGVQSLLTTDQGVRGFLHVVNDLCFVRAPKLNLNRWSTKNEAASVTDDAITTALTSLGGQPVAKFVTQIAEGLASFDWRTASTKGLSDEQRRAKLVFRGSSGYRELRFQLLEHLEKFQNDAGATARVARQMMKAS